MTPEDQLVPYLPVSEVELAEEQQRQRDSAVDPGVWETAFRSRARRTIETYRYWWGKFEAWCSEVRRTAMPATSATVASYANWLKTQPGRGKGNNRISPNTVDLALTAVQYAHNINRQVKGESVVPLLDMSLARDVAIGYRKIMENEFHWKPHEVDGLRTEHVRRIVPTIDRHSVKGMRDAAALLMHLDIFARGAEIGRIRIKDIHDWGEDLEVDVIGAKAGSATVPVAENPWETWMCPVNAWRVWRGAMLDNGASSSSPAFPRVPLTWEYPDEWKPLTNLLWTSRLKKLGKNAGLNLLISAHSLRYGPAEECLENEMPYMDVKQRGRWESDTSFHRYARRANRRVTNPMKKMAAKRAAENDDE